MRVSRDDLLFIRQEIEKHTLADNNITDVIITYKVQKNDKPRNYLYLEI